MNYYRNDYLGRPPGGAGAGGLQEWLFGRQVFALDALNAPLLPAVALLHFLTALAPGGNGRLETCPTNEHVTSN